MTDRITPTQPRLMIRPIELRDSAEVCILTRQLGYDRSVDEIVHWIHSLKDRISSQAAFVANLGDEVVGWIEINIEHRLQSAPCALIGGLVVKDGFRNQRIGLRLCECAELWSWEAGVAAVRVTSRSTRLDAHRFYLNNGYSLTKISHIFEKQRPE
ncbi:GNAT family N-acetyltransferase [Telmatobacter sp. DSM 110680]|uniref:GNAT family N-acetyltransferase n=1 Tax=Telmatobacter sp. DSM 110680 TaxID=3036704 RepID=A0AAU7DNI5_9BACT